MDYKKHFIELFNSYIERDGSGELLKSLLQSDFFTAPASTRYHESYEGGLAEHSCNVFYELVLQLGKDSKYNMETIAIVALLHDVCKVGYYSTELRNKKNDETGKWEKVPFYTIDDKFPFGHGEKSVYMILEHMKLTTDEAMAIRFHMGAYEGQQIWNTLGGAYKQCPLAMELHFADMRATYAPSVITHE